MFTQVGPQTSVLGSKARENGFTVSLVARLHKLYGQEDLQKAAKPYQAVMLTNHRSHPSLLCLPNSLFYDCSLQVSMCAYVRMPQSMVHVYKLTESNAF